MKIPVFEIDRQTRGPEFGLIIVLFSMISFSFMNLGVRLLGAEMRPDSVVFYRSLFQLLILAPGFKGYLEPRSELLGKLKFHFLRGFFGILSMVSLYFALTRIPLGLATLLALTSAIWAALFSWIILGERPSGQSMVCGLLMYLGVGVCFWRGGFQGASVEPMGIMAGAACGISMGFAMTFLRKMRSHALDTREIVFFFGMTGVLMTLPGFSLHPEFPTTVQGRLLLLLIAVSATLGQLLMTTGFRYVTAMVVGLCQLLGAVLNVFWGIWLLNEFPERTFYLGSLLVGAGLIGLIHGSRRQKSVNFVDSTV